MKTFLLLLPALAITAIADDEIIPTPSNKERLTRMLEKSPFVLATPPVKEEKLDVKTPFDNMFIKALATDYVVIQRVGDDHTMRFWGNTPGEEEIFVKEIKWSDKAGVSKVILGKGAEVSPEIGFNENDIRSQAPPPPPQRGVNQGVPGTQRPPGTNVPNAPRTGGNINVPRPAVQPNITVPRPSGTLTQPPQNNFNGNRTNTGVNRSPGAAPTQAAPANDPSGNRRRIREIGR
jgi:hypothetical protein